MEELIQRYSQLDCIRGQVIEAYLLMETCYKNGGKLLIAGNGGSAADSEHIAGELMKRFKIARQFRRNLRRSLFKLIR